jgi:hypothetical protein
MDQLRRYHRKVPSHLRRDGVVAWAHPGPGAHQIRKLVVLSSRVGLGYVIGYKRARLTGASGVLWWDPLLRSGSGRSADLRVCGG